MNQAEMENMIRDYIDAYNGFDIEAMAARLHPEVHFINVSGGEVNAETEGLEAFVELAEASLALFSSRHQAVAGLTFDGDRVTVSIDFEARVAKDLPNGIREGAVLQFTGTSEFEFRDGKIYKIRDAS